MKEVLFNTHDIVLLVTIYVSLLFATLLIVQQTRRPSAGVWLALFLICQAGLVFYVLGLYGEAFKYWAQRTIPHSFVFLESVFWLEGAFLLMYTRATLYGYRPFKKHDLLVFSPLIVFFIALVFIYTFPASEPALPAAPAFLNFIQSSQMEYYEYIRCVVRAGYGVVALVEIKRYETLSKNAYSNSDLLSYQRLKALVVGFIIMRLLTMGYVLTFKASHYFPFLSAIGPIDYDLLGILNNYGELTLITILLSFGLSDSRFISRVEKHTLEALHTRTDEQPPEDSPDPNKNDIDELKTHYTDEQIERVRRYMLNQQPYLDSQLKIDDLAKKVSIPTKTLSLLINREFNCNFFEFVNGYRLEDIKKRLSSEKSKDIAIIDLALDSGFNSKATFNRLFKKHTGQTPSEYRHHCQ